MKPERCEMAMKTVTDFLVLNKIPNLYVYIVDNKEDNVWESSISVFYTQSIRRKADLIWKCLSEFTVAFCVGMEAVLTNTVVGGWKCL
jgi:hypothetical protein